MKILAGIALASTMMVGLTAHAPAASAHGVDEQAVDVYAFADVPDVQDVGDARLQRGPHGVTATASVDGAVPGVYTMWWVVWNNPQACGDDGCDAADFGTPGLNLDIGYAGGDVVQGDGRLRVTRHLREGRPLTGLPVEFGITSGDGLLDADSSEVHLVLRSHGPVLRGLTGDMRRTFNGGCVYPNALPAEYGTPGPNTCEDVYFAVFP
jgi:hypothetical protein